MKSLSLLLKMLVTLCVFSWIPGYTQINEWEWNAESVSEETVYSTDIACDDFNNIYFSGYHYGIIQIGDSVFDVQDGMSGAFVAGYDKNGNFRWAVSLKKGPEGPFGMVNDCHLAVDSRQNLYIAGEFDFSVDFGDTVLQSYGNWDVFIAKYDSSGQFQWAYQIGGATDDQYRDIKIDLHDNIYLSVNHSRPSFDNTVYYGDNDTTLNFYGYCAAILALQPNASFSWITCGTGEYYEVNAGNLVLYQERHLFAQFSLLGEFHFDGQIIEADLEPITHLVVPIDEYGNTGSYMKFPHDLVADMLIDNQSNFYSCGVFNQPMIILGDTLVPTSYFDYILVKYDYHMEPLWYITFLNNAIILDIKMDLDWDDGIYLSTPFVDELILADTLLKTESEGALFIAKINPYGNVTGAEIIPSDGFIYCTSLKLDHCRNLLLGGGYNSKICLGADTLSITPGTDAALLAKYINESSFLDLGNDTLVYISDTLVVSVDDQAEYIEWSDGSTGVDFEFRAVEYGEGFHSIGVLVKSNTGCYDTDTITIHVVDNSFLNEKNITIDLLYPNPASGNVQIKSKSTEVPQAIVFYNQVGFKVITLHPLNNLIDIRGLKPGVYIVELIFRENILRRRLIIL